MRLSVLIVLLVAVVCVVSATKAKKSGFLDKAKKQKLAKMIVAAKRSEAARKKKSKSGPLEKKGDDWDDYGYCIGAKCECNDWELKGAFLSVVGNVVATCRVSDLYVGAYVNLIIEFLEDKKRKRIDTAEDFYNGEIYDFFDEACDFMADLGLYFEESEYDFEPQTIEEEYDLIFTCCDYKEFITTFHCLGTYMSLFEMKVAEYFHDDKDALKTSAFYGLEWLMRGQCDAVFHTENCLVMGLTCNPDFHQCGNTPSMLDTNYQLPVDIQGVKVEKIVEQYMAIIGAESGSGSGGESGSGSGGESGSGSGGESGNESGGESGNGGESGSGAASSASASSSTPTKREKIKNAEKELEGILRQILKQKSFEP